MTFKEKRNKKKTNNKHPPECIRGDPFFFFFFPTIILLFFGFVCTCFFFFLICFLENISGCAFLKCGMFLREIKQRTQKCHLCVKKFGGNLFLAVPSHPVKREREKKKGRAKEKEMCTKQF